MEQSDLILAIELVALAVLVGLAIWRMVWLRGGQIDDQSARRPAYDMRRDGQRLARDGQRLAAE